MGALTPHRGRRIGDLRRDRVRRAERLCIGLESSGCEILHHEATYPGQLAVRTPGDGPSASPFTCTSWTWLGFRGRRWGIWLSPARTVQAARYGDDLVLGYAPGLDLFVSWPWVEPRRVLPRRLEVDRGTLPEAERRGFCRDRDDGDVVAFTPEHAWRHLTTRRVGTRPAGSGRERVLLPPPPFPTPTEAAGARREALTKSSG